MRLETIVRLETRVRVKKSGLPHALEITQNVTLTHMYDACQMSDIYMCVRVYIHTCICIYIYMYTHIYIYTYI